MCSNVDDNRPPDMYSAGRKQVHTEYERLEGHGPIAKPLYFRVCITHLRDKEVRDMTVDEELHKYLSESNLPDE